MSLFYSDKIKLTPGKEGGIIDAGDISGHKWVNTVEELLLIPDSILSSSGSNQNNDAIGQLWYVNSMKSMYQLIDWGKRNTSDGWKKFVTGGNGIPILTQDRLNDLDEVEVPEEYIFIPTEGDLDGSVEDNTIVTQNNGSYLDIIFQTLRQLQSEVARMRNAFKYGMVSYTGTQTAMSSTISDIEDPEEEPLWAVDPDGLSFIPGATISITDTHGLRPKENVNVIEGALEITNTASWTDFDLIVKSCEDSKLFYYLTTSSLNISIDLKDVSEDKNYSLPIYALDRFGLNKYEVLLIISRKFPEEKSNSDELYGKNYIYISITNPKTDFTLTEGYWNPETNSLSSSMVELDGRYYPYQVNFTNLSLYKADMYSKFQEFSQEVIPSKPDDEEYKYKVAHLTIRAVSNKAELDSIKDQLLENELIFEEETKRLWIKNKYNIVSIGASGGGSSDNEDMSIEELIEKLRDLGIVYESNSELELSSVSGITFIHQGSGKSFTFEVNSDGQLESNEVILNTLEKKLEAVNAGTHAINKNEQHIRGFVARLHCGEHAVNSKNEKDVKINSDRVKIGAVYCPLSSDTTHGCSHAYVELENTSSYDFPLDGCYLHFAYTTDAAVDNVKIEHLPLKGVIPAGSTYLIRGKKYSDPETDPKTYIVVDEYDLEWWVNRELIDFAKYNDGKRPHGFALTYGNDNITPETRFFIANPDPNADLTKVPYIYPWYFIDSITINDHFNTNNTPWGANTINSKSNTLIKNTFELDPAKQALQALNTYDSSRYRSANIATDIAGLNLDKEFIEFPHSDEKRAISYYTPRCSKSKKNVGTDKTKLDYEKPNAVNCSFGINSFTTRCFNWVSAGEYDEYVWIKKADGTWDKFESYTKVEEMKTVGSSFPRRKEFSVDINNTIYARIIGNFPIDSVPGHGPHYTAHKCIIEVVQNAVSSKTTYTYVVGRADKTGNAPDMNHCCDEHTFTLYPTTYVPKLYLTSDQQGFHWVEYQVWAASAKAINEKITSECAAEGNTIIPVLMNSGDMTQNGTRVNEWLDYFIGAECLLKHLEHAAVVGNNDLCGPDPEVLGTGDDAGKSNSFYFHVFFCYEVSTLTYEGGYSSVPIINNKYIPSLYYIDFSNHRLLMCNSEITATTCKTWYNTGTSVDSKDCVVNVYTGFITPTSEALSSDSKLTYQANFNTVYTMMWIILNDAKSKTKKMIVCCHEMPFTVITKQCIGNDYKGESRSTGPGESSLVGCHMNQINILDKKALYWFSRLLEYFEVKLVLGGHKHTYTCTHPVRENYFYGENNSKVHGPMNMTITLENDNAVFKKVVDGQTIDYSKLPLIEQVLAENYCLDGKITDIAEGYFYPCEADNETYKKNRVVYFMTQATGYKQTSNKELPTNYQGFSYLIPQTTATEKADDQQKYPMYVEVVLTSDTAWELSLIRIANIQTTNFKFTQTQYNTNDISFEFAKGITRTSISGITTYGTKYCSWESSKQTTVTIQL